MSYVCCFTGERVHTAIGGLRFNVKTARKSRYIRYRSHVRGGSDGCDGNSLRFTFAGFDISQLCQGSQLFSDAPNGPVCTDSRILREGDWFLALSGGHNFVIQAIEAGAIGLVVSRSWYDQSVERKVIETSEGVSFEGGLVVVQDTTIALLCLASAARSSFGGPVVGITGSVGKTTCRSMV